MNRQYFDFSPLITDYANEFEVLIETGAYDEAGDWQTQTTKATCTGAIIAFAESRVLRSEGAITAQDRRLFTHAPLPGALIGAKVRYNGQVYRIDTLLENAEFTGVYSYLLKWVSAFDTD